MRKRDPIDFDRLLPERDGDKVDPSACPDCDGTLVPNGPMTADTGTNGRVRRHCSRCETSVEQRWELDRSALTDDRTFETLLDSCPDCETALEPVGNFFDHGDGSGRQQRACPNCDVELDEWWYYREATTDE